VADASGTAAATVEESKSLLAAVDPQPGSTGLNQASSATVVPASYNVAAHSAERDPATSRYGYEPNYGSLSGRLEYSQATRQWKLRYIPIDGATDRYGGSVVIHDAAELEGYRPGEFVTVSGAIVDEKAAGSRFSPKYEIRRIVRQ
jgi:hypothetical protein